MPPYPRADWRGSAYNAPMSGPFSLCDPIAFGRHLRQIGHVGSLKQKPFASWHIIYKNMPNARTKKQERIGGMARAVHWDSERDVAEDGQYTHASLFVAPLESTIGRKERMPHRCVPPTIPHCNGRDEATIAA